MDSRAAVFVEVMIGIALAAVLAFVILMLARRARPAQPEGADPRRRAGAPPPLAVVMAVVVLLAGAAIVVWQLPNIMGDRGADARWFGEGRHAGFLIAMLAVAVVGLIAFIAALFMRPGMKSAAAPGPGDASVAEIPGEREAAGAPAAARLIGLLGLALAVLLLCWIYLTPARQYGLMLNLIYPAAFAVALVLLFDKATRGWSAKPAAESVREWLLGDLFVFLLVLGYLNLEGSRAGAKYASVLWDVVHVALFFLAFWMVDRKLTRYRFLIGYGYLIALPLVLAAWRATQGAAWPDGISWWETMWPFFFLAMLFFALEAVMLIAARDSRAGAAIKDAVFVAAYAVLLINAVPGAEG